MVAMDEFCKPYIIPGYLGERKCVEGKEEFVVSVKLVSKNESSRNKLGRRASSFGGYSFHCVDGGFHVLSSSREIDRQTPHRRFHRLGGWLANREPHWG